MNYSLVNKSLNAISSDLGILYHLVSSPNCAQDPKILGYGIWPCNTKYLGPERYEGRSSGCGYDEESCLLSTIGESAERYAPAFYNKEELIYSSYNDLSKKAHTIHPEKIALYHDKQFERNVSQRITKLTTELEVSWVPTLDLTNNRKLTYVPAQLIYLPFTKDNNWIAFNTSTGLAAHTNYYKAILTAIYECIERDSFVLTWMQKIVPPKIIISDDIQKYIDERFNAKHEWHFFDITYDLKIPTVFGICFGKADYGEFVSVGSSTRATLGEALKKVILEIGQTATYFRYVLGKKKEEKWEPSDNFSEIKNFEDHSAFYLKRQDLWHVFDEWKNARPIKQIDFNQGQETGDVEQILKCLRVFKNMKYNVLFKDITTPDIRQCGYYSIKIYIPQLIQLGGSYSWYFLGSHRLYTVPKQFGYNCNDFDNLNKYPHPFP